MFNPVIIIAIIVQCFVSKVSRIAGAVVGYLITTGILVWGFSLYADGYQVAFFGIPLSQTVFLFACAWWYSFDTKEFNAAARENSDVNAEDKEGVAVLIPAEEEEEDNRSINIWIRVGIIVIIFIILMFCLN